MLRLLFYTAVRVSELVGIRVEDVDLGAGRIFIERGKGDKDRYILFPDSFRLLLKAYLAVNPDTEYLFESRRRRPYSTRRVQQIIQEYAAKADLTAHVHPHLFRHQMLTWLASQGVPDAAIQLHQRPWQPEEPGGLPALVAGPGGAGIPEGCEAIGGLTMANLSRYPVGRPSRHDLDPQKVKCLRDHAVSWREIAARLGVGVGTARRAYKGILEDASADSLAACQNSAGPSV